MLNYLFTRAAQVFSMKKQQDQNDRPLSNRVALVTGASRGIGREIALMFARQGANVVIAAKSTEPQPTLPGTIHTVAAEARDLGVDALPFKCDVRDDQNVHDMIEATIRTFGRLDYLVCNSGALWWRDVEHTPMSRYDLVNSVNARATFNCIREALPHMRRANFGRIVVMSPPIDFSLLKGKVAYSLSKFGMTLIAMGLARELADTDIAVNALWPATLIESFATKNFKIGEESQWRKAHIVSDCVLRMVQEPQAKLNGCALIDEDYLRSRGVTDLTKYQCVPGIEPRKAWPPDSDVWAPKTTAGLPPGVTARL